MLHRRLIMSALVGALSVSLGVSFAAGPGQAQTQGPAQAQEQVFGSQLMTRQERIEYRTRMRAAKTVEEREKLRLEHHERMVERARERGLTLPEQPVPGGAGMGPGGGIGPGAGMGPRR